MKSKTRKMRDRANRLGLQDPTLTSGVSREEISAFYKRGGRTATKQEKTKKAERKYKNQIKQKYA